MKDYFLVYFEFNKNITFEITEIVDAEGLVFIENKISQNIEEYSFSSKFFYYQFHPSIG
jgi:hypothetical protein